MAAVRHTPATASRVGAPRGRDLSRAGTVGAIDGYGSLRGEAPKEGANGRRRASHLAAALWRGPWSERVGCGHRATARTRPTGAGPT
ncbi:hypothetical protein ACZ91_06015 [Streptomyces regensis]|nr:hypothetical protein ACZ91_06015 [Streptomyces regensis]